MAEELKTNVLYFGDNLEILRNHIPANSVDLIYLDPPFNSKKDYNILFKENGGVESEAQIHAFTDSWHWTQAAQDTYHEIVTKGPLKVGKLIDSLHEAIGSNDVMAYLVMMTIRLVELHRVLKPTGSLYLHCDPTASHYLKLVLDQIFGPANFRNEIVWKRTNAHNMRTKGYVRSNDVIFYYTKTNSFTFNDQFTAYSSQQIKRYKADKDGRLFTGQDLTFSTVNPSRQFEWRGTKPASNRSWGASYEQLEKWYLEDRILLKKDGAPRLDGMKVYLDEMKGIPISTNWTDIPRVRNTASERLGYETQKPLALLERIIQASSNEGDIVLDPFCGCGTAVVAAQKLNRKWIGIDITNLAIALMRNRLKDSFNIEADVIGEPVDLAGAKALARQDRYQFQWWALNLINARPVGEQKKGADKGIDGIIQFIDEASGKAKRVIIQVKSGHIGVNAVRELKAVSADEAIGVLITLEPPTGPMKVEAVEAGYYHSPIWNEDYPKLQVLTIEELLQGKLLEMPPQTQSSVTFTKAPRISKKEGEQLSLKE